METFRKIYGSRISYVWNNWHAEEKIYCSKFVIFDVQLFVIALLIFLRDPDWLS